MCTYLIQREYVVLCHGFLDSASGVLDISGRILEGQIRLRARSMYGERCRVDNHGKPAQSKVRPISHVHLDFQELFSILAVSIVTGRQHQIRTHLQHVGHPTVYDGRYVLQEVLLQNCRLEDVAHAPADPPRPRPLPEWHRAELELRGAYPW